MYSREKNNWNVVFGTVRVGFVMANVITAGCCICQSECLSPWDGELSTIMESHRAVKVCDTSEEFLVSSHDLVSLASRLEAVCLSRNISRCAVTSAVHMEPFAYDDRSIAYALIKQGFLVDGIEFEFDHKGCVAKVRPFHVEL